MLRALVLASLVIGVPTATSGQALSVLHIKVALTDAAQQATAVPRHVLLVSENPASATPWRLVTALDGTASIKLRPGNYTVESDRPVAFDGKAYQWTQMVDVVAGRDALLELTAGNAEVGPLTAADPTAPAPSLNAPTFLLPQWQDSVVALWTPSTRASGFVIDPKGLIMTSQRAIGTATAIEVQITAEVKVGARLLAADPVRDVAVLWIDPQAVAAVRPLTLGCADAAKPPVVDGQELLTIGAPQRGQKTLTTATVSRVEAHAIVADFIFPRGSAGGPVFTPGGAVVGITSVADRDDDGGPRDAPVVRIEDACEVLASAATKMKDVTPPDGTRLPVEPARPFPVQALEEAVKGRAGSLSPYQTSSADFDIAFITPVLTYGAQYQTEQARRRERTTSTRTPAAEPSTAGPLMDFSNWSDYVADFPPVLLVRVTPRLVEGFWTTVARGAAATQGISLPPIKRFKPGFSRLRAFCGEAEVTPIHPFTLERRTSETDAIREGLYVFDPAALGPECKTVKLVLYSEKAPDKGDTRVVDQKVIQQAWQDFAAYRAG